MGIYIEKLDKPENCSGCPCRGTRRITQDLFCRITRQSIDEFYAIEKAPDWCPIIETSEDWSAQRFKNMDKALTRIEPIAEAIQAAGTAILEIINEGFTTKERSDEDRTEDA